MFQDAAITPLGKPVCDLLTIAKRSLRAGEMLDGHGGFMCYGMIENFDTSKGQQCLPMGLAEGCRLKRDIQKDQALTYGDVELTKGRLCDKLREEQDKFFS